MLVPTVLHTVGSPARPRLAAVPSATNATRMVTAMSLLITASIEPRRCGGLMSVIVSAQHVASGLGATVGGPIVEEGGGEPQRHFGTVGILVAGTTSASLGFAAHNRPAA